MRGTSVFKTVDVHFIFILYSQTALNNRGGSEAQQECVFKTVDAHFIIILWERRVHDHINRETRSFFWREVRSVRQA